MADRVEVPRIEGKIYRITSASTDLVYIGSTKKSLGIRFSGHKCSYAKWLNDSCNYMSSYKILAFPDAKIELVENFTCDDTQELRRREGEIILETPNCVNNNIAGLSTQESTARYYRRNSDKCKVYQHKFYQAHREKYAQYYKANRDKHCKKHSCPCGGRYTAINKNTHLNSKKHKRYLKQQRSVEVDSDVDLIDDLDCLFLGYE